VLIVRFARPDLDEWLRPAPSLEDCELFHELCQMALDGLGQGQTLVLNLALVESVSQELLKLLLLIRRVVAVCQGRLVLCRPGASVLEGLRSRGLLPLFHVTTTETEALRGLTEAWGTPGQHVARVVPST